MCMSTSRMDMGRAQGSVFMSSLPPEAYTSRSAQAGMKRATGSPSWKWPCSKSCINATDVIGLVIE